jgi:CubicO group peptidase (beta-lactamase class C family)
MMDRLRSRIDLIPRVIATVLLAGPILLAACQTRSETGALGLSVDTSAASIAAVEATPALEEAAAYTAEEAYGFRKAMTIDNWDDGGPLMRYIFLNMGEFFNESVIHRTGPIAPLDYDLRDEIGEFETSSRLGEMSLDDYIHEAAVDGIVIVHRGKIVYEAYPKMRARDKHLLMSVSKGYASTLVAILEDRGLIDQNAAIETYLPELVGSGWEGVSVLDILDMASGIDCHESNKGSYSDPAECYYQYEASLGWLGATEATLESPYEYLATLQRHRPAGEAFEYSSPNTFILSWLIETVTGKTYVEVLSEEIWLKIGTESDGLLSSPRRGIPIAHGGISATLRDMARFGLLFTPSWNVVATGPVISPAYAEKIRSGGRPEIHDKGINANPAGLPVDGEMPRHNTYQWDLVMEDGDFFKGGYGGQGLYISPSRDIVVAYFGTFEVGGNTNQLDDVSRQISKSDLFD